MHISFIKLKLIFNISKIKLNLKIICFINFFVIIKILIKKLKKIYIYFFNNKIKKIFFK